ncbi:hypothetical protein KDD17_04435 [Sulfitobacter albidus]|uniref:Uncharacterized protein n=1 Tax=Sulfitobacter albidus TaxID=2829501 RepID=A0A975PN12_9RHOB|nr:hypothetical protein [Sulfitobacter albidus]QUJ77269.1 hypothetical protein KDD17_04435 [Sulfitobacter albidus]
MRAEGFVLYPHDPSVARWAQAAGRVARRIARDPAWHGPDNLRHGGTWFVGVDALPNASDGAIDGVPLLGPWRGAVPDIPLHPAQLSIVYPGYPQQDAGESDANHRFRRDRMAAHVDGLLPIGPQRRRFAREFHAYILALPLTDVRAAATVVWPGSQRIMQTALQEAVGARPVAQVDLTDAYQAARREVFASIDPVRLLIGPGQSALLHRFLLHGTAPWENRIADKAGHGRMTAFLRPEMPGGGSDWLASDPV